MTRSFRLFRFRLKHLLLLTTAICCACGYWAYLRRDLRNTYEAMRQARLRGGSVDVYCAPATFWTRCKDALYGGPVPHEVTIQFQRRHAGTASWGNWGVHGETVQILPWNADNFRPLGPVLQQISALRGLSFWDSEVPDGLLTEILPHSTQLKWLQLSGTKLQGSELHVLSRVPQLESLQLASTRVTDEDLRFLTHLKLLDSLSLHDTRITDTGFTTLAPLRIRKRLQFDMTRITPAVIPMIVAWQAADEVLVPAEWPEDAVEKLKAQLPPKCDCRRSASLN